MRPYNVIPQPERAASLVDFFYGRYGPGWRPIVRRHCKLPNSCQLTVQHATILRAESFARRCGWTDRIPRAHERNLLARWFTMTNVLLGSNLFLQPVTFDSALQVVLLHNKRDHRLIDQMETPDSLGFERSLLRIPNPCKPPPGPVAEVLAMPLQPRAAFNPSLTGRPESQGGFSTPTFRSSVNANFWCFLPWENFENGGGI